MRHGREFCPTGPPFGICPLAPEAFITTEAFLPWSFLLTPFVLLLALPDWAPTTGEVADMEFFPLTEELLFSWPCWTGAEAPVTDEPVVLLESFAAEE